MINTDLKISGDKDGLLSDLRVRIDYLNDDEVKVEVWSAQQNGELKYVDDFYLSDAESAVRSSGSFAVGDEYEDIENHGTIREAVIDEFEVRKIIDAAAKMREEHSQEYEYEYEM